MVEKKAIVNDQEYDIPEGIVQITDDGLYMVDFNLIQRAAETEKNFFNPRHLGGFDYEDENGNKTRFLGQGFGKEEMKELMTDIAKKGLDYPFLCRWILEDGKIRLEIYDGERRHRCTERLIINNDDVWSEENQKYLPAKEVFARVPCRIKAMSDEEAMSRACTVSETAVKWGDAALAKLIKLEYERGKSDEMICKMLGKSPKWVADTYSLNRLDEVCFDYLLQGKINRTVANLLLNIEDVEERQQRCIDGYTNAVRNHQKTVEHVEKLVEKSEEKEEIVKAELEEAKLKNESPEVIEKLEEEVKKTEEKTAKRKKSRAASAKPMAKSKDLRGGSNPPKVTSAKIAKQIKILKEIIEKKDESYGSTDLISAIVSSLEALLDGADIKDVLKKAS